MAELRNLYIGCAGWQVPKSLTGDFGGEGTHLERYAHRLHAVEVNSSFYREHRRRSWEKWRNETPDGFRFAVKAPRWLTHDQGLQGTEGLDAFLEQIGGLGNKLGPVLLQLPPKLAFHPEAMRNFFEALRARHSGPVVCEPRHESWLSEEADAFLEEHRVARAEVDPSRHAGDDEPGGWPGLRYVRLHGSPQRFYSEYEQPWLREMAQQLRAFSRDAETWCIFNNTARDGGARNALTLRRLVEEEPASTHPDDPAFDLGQRFLFYRHRPGPPYLLKRVKPRFFQKKR